MSASASAPKPPALDEAYHILPGMPSASIDTLVGDILSRAQLPPVRCTADAEEVASALSAALPERGQPLRTVVDELLASAATYYRKNAHPGMFSYVASPGLPTDPIGHALTAALNQNVTGYQSAPGATAVERTVIGWLCALAGLPHGSDGLLVSGGSVANLSAIAAAVYRALGPEFCKLGIHGGMRPVILAAETAHFSIQRAAVMLGLGRVGVETVAVDDDHRLDVRALQAKLEALAGQPERKVCCVVASAGTTALGVVDPLADIAALCSRYRVWLHVDAAYGGAVLLSDALRGRLEGIGRADSITIDLHKWGYLAFDASALLYREPAFARELYAFEADYAEYGQDMRPETYRFFDMSPEVSRRNRALPVYLAWRHYGLEILGRNVEHNAECARYLAELVVAASDMELIGKPDLSICCFRYLPLGMQADTRAVDHLNARIVEMLNTGGNFLLSPTLIDGRPVLRVCICSHATRAGHMEELVSEVRRIGRELVDGTDQAIGGSGQDPSRLVRG